MTVMYAIYGTEEPENLFAYVANTPCQWDIYSARGIVEPEDY